MDDLIAAFNTLGVSDEVIGLVNADISSMANHYLTQHKTDPYSVPEFSPNPICDYSENPQLNQQILSYVNQKGEMALIEKILAIDPNAQIDPFDISTYINYYVSLVELAA